MRRKARVEGARIQLVPFVEAAPLVQVDTLEQIESIRSGALNVTGAIVKVAPVLQASQRSGFDAHEIAAMIRERGAVSVVVVPKVVAEARLSSVAAVEVTKAATAYDSVSAWFAELKGITDEDRAECIDHAMQCIAQAEGT